jgi:phosphomannomutase/phosphoglucomutase
MDTLDKKMQTILEREDMSVHERLKLYDQSFKQFWCNITCNTVTCINKLVYYATYSKAATSGVMITGSHNPPEYNGFKIMIAGETLTTLGVSSSATMPRIS